MIYQSLYSRAIYPLYHWLLRDGANAAIRYLESNESLDAASLGWVAQDKLRRLMKFAAENVPYYRRVLSDLGISSDNAAEPGNFARIPILTKSAINDNRDSLIAENLDHNGLDENSTGGSTGEVLRFFTDWRSGAFRKATVRRNKGWLGILPGDREVRLWGSPLDLAGSKSFRGAFHTAITRERLLSAYSLDEETLQSYLQFCRSFKPKLLVAYPSALALFASFCASRNESIESLHAIICSAETLFEHDRQLIENTFGVKVYNRYGCREVGDIAQEAPGVSGLLVNSDRIFVEVLDDRGNSCAPGVQGEIVVTDLDNFGMPLIRYRIGDYARWADRDAVGTSKYPFPVLASVDGRTMDVVRCPGGQRVGGTYWTLLLRSQPGLKKIQVIQDKPETVTILYEREPDCVPDFDYFRKEITKTCGPEIGVEFVETTQFEHDPGTKFRLVICRVETDD